MKIRKARVEDLEEISGIEKECFPKEEAATKDNFKERLEVYSDYFWILENDDGKIVSFVNGMVTDSDILEDVMFDNPRLHNKNGKWQMIFGVNTLPLYRNKGYASILIKKVIEDSKNSGRLGIVLTCKEKLIKYYESFGFINKGISKSVHGGTVWYDMKIIF